MRHRTRLLLVIPIVVVVVIINVIVKSNKRSLIARRLLDATEIFENVSQSVVYIDAFGKTRLPFTFDEMEVPLGAGSGFVWDKKGHIITNYHVVQDSTYAEVTVLFPKTSPTSSNPQSGENDGLDVNEVSTVNDGDESNKTQTEEIGNVEYTSNKFRAEVVGVDPGKDVAVLKIEVDENDLKPIVIGTSSNLKVGQAAYAIGNPFGLDHSMTSGIISGLKREARSPSGRLIQNVIQTDADVNPGNSGGPLLDGDGKVIGINSITVSTTGASAGIGMAIPIDDAKISVETLIKDGKVVRATLGITFLDSPELAKSLGVEKGVMVMRVDPDSPAKKAGLQGSKMNFDWSVDCGDVIVKIDDTSVEKEGDLVQVLEKHKPGDKVQLTVKRPVGGKCFNDGGSQNVIIFTNLMAQEEVKEKWDG